MRSTQERSWDGEVTAGVGFVLETAARLEWRRAPESPGPWREAVTGTVYYTGAWSGALRVSCDETAACAFAAAFMGLPLAAQVDGAVQDAVGELANMIGGQVKALLPPGVTMSVPVMDLRDAVRGRQWRFLAGGGRIEVTLVEFANCGGAKRYSGD